MQSTSQPPLGHCQNANLPPNHWQPYPQNLDLPAPIGHIPSRKPAVLPQSYDGLSSWTDWFCHFKQCILINQWNMEQSKEFLVVSLRKKALQIFQDLPVHETLRFDTLVNALEEKFNPSQQCEMYKAQLRSRTKLA